MNPCIKWNMAIKMTLTRGQGRVCSSADGNLSGKQKQDLVTKRELGNLQAKATKAHRFSFANQTNHSTIFQQRVSICIPPSESRLSHGHERHQMAHVLEHRLPHLHHSHASIHCHAHGKIFPKHAEGNRFIQPVDLLVGELIRSYFKSCSNPDPLFVILPLQSVWPRTSLVTSSNRHQFVRIPDPIGSQCLFQQPFET